MILALVFLAAQVAADPSPTVGAPEQVTETPSIVEVEETGGLGLRSVAIYQMTAEGIEPRIVDAVLRHLVIELRKREGLLVIDLEDLKAALNIEAERQAFGCDEEDTSCLVEVTDALGVDELLLGVITDVGQQRVFALRRLDRKGAKTVASASRSLTPAGGEELLAALGPIAVDLYPGHPLREGQVAGVPPEVALRLNPPPLPASLTTSTLVGAGVSAVIAAGAGVFAWQQLEAARAVTNASATTPRTAAEATAPYNNAVVASYTAQVFGVTAGALLLAGGVMLPFTDFTRE